MIVYPYRCSIESAHYHELLFPFGEYPKELPCLGSQNESGEWASCDGTMHRVIGLFNFNIDNVDKMDLSFTRQFSNKGEYYEYLKQNDLRIIDDSELADSREELARSREEYLEVTSRGKNWKQHLAEKAAEKQAANAERLKSLGIKVNRATPDEIISSIEDSSDWNDGVSNPYLGDPIHDKRGEHVGWKGKGISKEDRNAITNRYNEVVTKKNYSEFKAVK